MATGIQVVFDWADPDTLARFWAEAIGYQLQDPPTGDGSWAHWAREQGIPQERWNDASAVDPDNRGPRLYFQRVPEAKTTSSRRCWGQSGSPAWPTRPGSASTPPPAPAACRDGPPRWYRCPVVVSY